MCENFLLCKQTLPQLRPQFAQSRSARQALAHVSSPRRKRTAEAMAREYAPKIALLMAAVLAAIASAIAIAIAMLARLSLS